MRNQYLQSSLLRQVVLTSHWKKIYKSQDQMQRYLACFLLRSSFSADHLRQHPHHLKIRLQLPVRFLLHTVLQNLLRPSQFQFLYLQNGLHLYWHCLKLCWNHWSCLKNCFLNCFHMHLMSLSSFLQVKLLTISFSSNFFLSNAV